MIKKIPFLLLFFVSVSVFSQTKDGVIKVRKRQSTLPTIAGIAGGEIEAALFCSGEGITVNKKVKVISFVFLTVQGNREVSIKHSGNKLNTNACEVIAVLQSGAEVFINEIAVEDDQGRQSITTPMRFKIK